MIRAALLDDEPPHTRSLQLKLLELAGDIEIIATFSDPEEALAALPSARLDVLFLDVEMPRLTGFQLLSRLERVNFEVIFVSAFQDYAVRAIRFSALDFLTKPVDREELAEALIRLRQKLTQKTTPENRREQLDLLLDFMQKSQPAQDQRIALPTASDIRFVCVSEIVRVESDNNYSTFFLKNRERVVVSRTLKEYERLLETHGFCRIGRSNLVNLSFVSRFIKAESAVSMTDGSIVEVAANKKEELLKRLAGG